MNTAKNVPYLDGYYIAEDANVAQALAEIFCCLLNDDQAQFFNWVQELSAEWPTHRTFQWRMMEGHISHEARKMLQEMIDHTAKEPA